MSITKREWAVLAIAAAALAVTNFLSLGRGSVTRTIAAHSGAAVEADIQQSEHQPSSKIAKVLVPQKFQFSQLSTPVDVDNIEAWLATFPEADRAKLRQFSSRYFGIYKVAGPGQIKWMQENGYPMPEDVIEASMLTTDELKARAGGGNEKAKMLLLDRLINDYAEKRQVYVSSGQASSDFNNSDGKELAVAILDAERDIGSVDSPFAFLLKSRNAELLENADVVTADATRISSILAAYALGETRSVAMLADCVASGLCSAEDVEIATATSLSVDNVSALSRLRDSCRQSLATQMPPK